ncbi:MAG: GIY-YIG nuclease family protein [Polyangiaceae bacterium]|nr:GIY-YIG nuclease family protein [Polyangiaceae bacterium]
MLGRSVRLFLVDGTPQGMRTAEVGNWSGLALVCPRTDLARLGTRPEVRRTGVYILVGPSEVASSAPFAVYVGEGDEVWTRLTSHDDSKDFWTWVVIFVSKDDNLTKAHVRWLEATLIREIKKAKRAEVTNASDPVGGRLPEADTSDMETFFENIRLLLPTLGVNVFSVERPEGLGDKLVLELRWEHAQAECVVREGQFVVKAGSLARAKEVDSLGDSTRTLRKMLKESGVLVPVDGNGMLLRFAQEYAFDSPSAASGVVAGTQLNGRIVWKVKGVGIPYKEWQEKQVAAAKKTSQDVV